MKQGDLLAYLWMTGRIEQGTAVRPFYRVMPDDPEFDVLITLLDEAEYLKKNIYGGFACSWDSKGLDNVYRTAAFVETEKSMVLNVHSVIRIAAHHSNYSTENRRHNETPTND